MGRKNKRTTEFNAEQIAWAKNMVRQINDKGTWGIPANGCTYQFFRSKKEIHLVQGDPTQDDWHEKNIRLFGAIGWKVLDRREQNKGKTFKVDSPHGQGKSWKNN
jgi:hypothetical protein